MAHEKSVHEPRRGIVRSSQGAPTETPAATMSPAAWRTVEVAPGSTVSSIAPSGCATGLNLDGTKTLAFGDCKPPARNRNVRCTSADRTVEATLKRSQGAAGESSFEIFLRRLDFTAPLAGPIELMIDQPGVSRRGSTSATCRITDSNRSCRS
jgi:hypothetical protein